MTLGNGRFPLLLGALALLAFGVACREAPRQSPAGDTGQQTNPPAARASARVVMLPGGGPRNLSEPSGKLLVVHFWATWCAPCEEELPGLVAWWDEAKADPRIELLAVSVDEEWATVDRFLAQRKASGLPVALDPRRTAASDFGTLRFPETWFLSPSGEVLHHQVGPLDWNDPASRAAIRNLADRAGGVPQAAS